METEPETVTVFRRFRKGGDVLALFPLLPEGRGLCLSYAHIGQHGAADFAGVVRASTPADPDSDDVRALARELASIGYRLRVVRRSPSWGRVTAARRAAGV